MAAAERGVGEKPENSGYYGSGQPWTISHAYEITLDVYPLGGPTAPVAPTPCAPCDMLKEVA